METVGYHELITLTAMCAVFAGTTFSLNMPVGLALVVSSIVGAFVGASAFPLTDLVRHLMEGGFAYLDAIMTIGSAMIFMRAIERSGLLTTLAARISKACSDQSAADQPLSSPAARSAK